MEYLLALTIFVIAILYSSVGHGGASGYLAAMAIFGVSTELMKASALTLNLFVAGMAFMVYYKGGYFKKKTVIPFLITSIPMAYFGAQVTINPSIYKIILGIFLLVAIGRMLIDINEVEKKKDPPFPVALMLGAVLGFFSGMIGIGGGIILTPLLLLLHWANVKEAAAASALFIFLNSAAGLTGLYFSGLHLHPSLPFFISLAFIGGIIGSYMGGFKFSFRGLTYFLAFVLLAASIKLFLF
jgi:uncharacterized membrane protein YfcA